MRSSCSNITLQSRVRIYVFIYINIQHRFCWLDTVFQGEYLTGLSDLFGRWIALLPPLQSKLFHRECCRPSVNFLGRFQLPVALFSLVFLVFLLSIGSDTLYITTFFVQALISIINLQTGSSHVGAYDLFIVSSLTSNHQSISHLPLFILSCSSNNLSTLQPLEVLYFHLFFNILNFFLFVTVYVMCTASPCNF